MANGTRTAPTVDGSPTWVNVSVSLIDHTGDVRTDTYQLDADSSDAEIEAFIAGIQLLSNTSIYRVTVGEVYNSTKDKTQALEVVWENVHDNVVVLEKTAVNVAQDFFVPAPIEAMFVAGTENINPAYADFVTFLATITPMRAAYSAISARFTHRKAIGTKINL